jgi:hypothetical protein
MKGFVLTSSLARSASAIAVATCLVMPSVALAQDAGSSASNAQPGAEQQPS